MTVLDMTLNNLMVRLWGMQSIPLLPLFPGPLAPDRVLSMGQIELDCVVWNRTAYMYKNGFGIK